MENLPLMPTEGLPCAWHWGPLGMPRHLNSLKTFQDRSLHETPFFNYDEYWRECWSIGIVTLCWDEGKLKPPFWQAIGLHSSKHFQTITQNSPAILLDSNLSSGSNLFLTQL